MAPVTKITYENKGVPFSTEKWMKTTEVYTPIPDSNKISKKKTEEAINWDFIPSYIREAVLREGYKTITLIK